MVLTCTHNQCFEQKYENSKKNQMKIVIFTGCMLHGRVFVMASPVNLCGAFILCSGPKLSSCDRRILRDVIGECQVHADLSLRHDHMPCLVICGPIGTKPQIGGLHPAKTRSTLATAAGITRRQLRPLAT